MIAWFAINNRWSVRKMERVMKGIIKKKRKEKEGKRDDISKSRRKFLKIAGSLSLLLGASTACEEEEYDLPHNKPPVPGSQNWYIGQEKFIKSACGQCNVNCGIIVRVVEGRAVKIKGNPASSPNMGVLGPKGNSGVFVLYDPDRIRSPLIRVGKKGKKQWREVGWDEAISYVSKKLLELKKNGDADKVAVLCGKPKGFIRDLFELFAYGYGTSNFYDFHSKSYSPTPLLIAMEEATGVFDLPGYDAENTQYILSLGAAIFESTCHGIYLAKSSHYLKYGRPTIRAKIVQVEPFLSQTGREVDEWIRIKPGRYDVFALGIANVLISEGMYDKKFVEENAEGFDKFSEIAKEFPPQRVEKEAGVPAKDLTRIARELWNSRPAIVIVDERSFSTTNDLSIACASLSLNALLGSINSRGGVIVKHIPEFSEWKVKYEKPGNPVDFSDLPNSDISVVLLYYMNPAYSEPDTTRWRKFLEKTFVISFSPFMDESTAYADVILPDHTYLERFEDAPSYSSTKYFSLGIRQPAVEPLYNTRNSGDTIIELGRKLGLNFYWNDFKEAVEERLKGVVQIDKLIERGYWDFKEGEEFENSRFKTPSGKFNFCWKHIGVSQPNWVGEGNIYFLPYKSITYAEGSGANIPYLQELSARMKGLPGYKSYETFLEISPELAEKLGVKNGDEVFVAFSNRKVKFPVIIVEGIQVDIVLVEMGKGHTEFGRFARGKGINPRDLLPPVKGLSGTLKHWILKVKVEKA